ncbi:UTP--glucose-1-phosphate uridylyltransferase [Actinomyces graevenitzii F0530]|uniref:UTP--glucose-1-phosphate uridylyltransferase n=1 Tax=Actinomyces graevenitzii F0530 TaxID=1321817 RepID=U1QF76_9ACTO|nr:UTP--glucose-1-phosphate uridylyltransferase [Actinomyces graevenitzii]ERH20574.1 UTP--glucose-1-phosphate uridylyltransferase [Actinomyces graevenitzii F0530]
MSEQGLRAAQDKMRQAGVNEAAVKVFTHYYHQVEAGTTGLIPEETISPLVEVPRLEDIDISEEAERSALAKTVIIRLNGGLGTSMGMDRAKSLLPVRDGDSFLDIIVRQVLAARERYGARLPLIFMDSFRTQDDTLAALAKYPQLAVDDLPLDFLQNQEPKLRADDLSPVSYPDDPSLEWCPPGHGDIYTALYGSGLLDKLIDAGFQYASTANADNLGAVPSAKVAGWFASSGAPYAAELCKRTPADVKGGHLAVRNSDGRIILRDTAQTPSDQMHYFTDQYRHPYFHTNNLWFDLVALREVLRQRDGVLGLPLIRNAKTVNPADSTTTPVVQIECAMGAAIEAFEGASAIEVPRSRFLPVKTTNDLMVLRSDAYEIDVAGQLNATVDQVCVVELDPKYYKTIHQFEQRVSQGAPSLRQAQRLVVHGDWTFGADVVVKGEVTLADAGVASQVPDGTLLE